MFNQKDSVSMMVDVETIGNESTPIIIQLSAVIFNIETGETYEEFDQLIDPATSVKYGLNSSASTIDWWLIQPKEAFNKVVVKAINEGLDICVVLDNFAKFIETAKKNHKVKAIKWYGNGDDWSWVASNYYATKRNPPVPFWDSLDVRTPVEWGIKILNINPKKTTVFQGIKHDAISDCTHQIKYLCEIYKGFSDLVVEKKDVK